METIEFEEAYISDVEGVSGWMIEPNEPIWQRALAPANAIAMGREADLGVYAAPQHTAEAAQAARGTDAAEALEADPATFGGIEPGLG